MAGGRPKKQTNSSMINLGIDLESPHMPDGWHELFDIYNELEAYPVLTAIIQKQIETVFKKHLKNKTETELVLNRPIDEVEAKKALVKFEAELWLDFDPIFSNWIGSKKTLTKKTIKDEVLVIQTEAHFLLKVATNMAHGIVRSDGYKKHFDHEYDVKAIAADAILKILVAGTYDVTKNIGQKLTYLKESISSAASERLKDKLRHGSTEEDQDLIDSPKYTARKRIKKS